jgi:hypothetical protein
LNSLIANGQTTPAGFPIKPEAVGWFAVSGPARGFADGRLKCFLRIARIARHQETKAVELREILSIAGGAHLFTKAAILRVSGLPTSCSRVSMRRENDRKLSQK